MALTSAGPARAAGGPFVVDDAEVDEVGACKLETWAAVASNNDRHAVAAPGCVVNLGRPVEIATEFAKSRIGDEWGASFALKAKTNLVPVMPGRIGVGLIVGSSADLVGRRIDGVFATIPVSLQLAERLRLNLNGGWLWDAAADVHAATWGAGLAFEATQRTAVIAEVFGVAGPGQEHRPGIQSGLRFKPREEVDIDLVYGRNLGGENANWVTIGLTLQFKPMGTGGTAR